MAKKKTNKSQDIRDYAAANPQATKAEIAKATKASYTLVFQALGKGKKKKVKRGRKATVASTNGHGDVYATIKAAADLIKTAGSLDDAKKALQVAGSLGLSA